MKVTKNLKNKGLLLIITIYLLIKIPFTIKNNILFTNIVNPIFWICIFIYVILDMKKGYFRFNINRKYCVPAIIISFINICIYFYLGFIFGFSKSMYKHSIYAMLQNFVIQLFPIIGLEFTRELIMARNKNKFLILYITVLLILLELNFNTIINLIINKEELFKYICSTIIPIIASSILYTYLALKSCYIFNLIYRIFTIAVILIMPIIPKLDWFVLGSLKLLSIVVIYLLFKYELIKEKSIKKKRTDFYAKITYLLALTLAVMLICFMLGSFKYEPISILSNSMQPKFGIGDVVIFEKLSEAELKEIPIGAIIVYSVNEKNIVHRVVDIIKTNGEILYKTKGDRNNLPDANLVQIEKIQGIYKLHLKYIGFPSVCLYYFFNLER